MFRHQGKKRTLVHNLRIATVLSFVAGIVNVSGFLAFRQLTTNVTGHFALFINDVSNFDFWKGTVYFLYIFFFFLGSFTSGFLTEKFGKNKELKIYVFPTTIEFFILIIIGFLSDSFAKGFPDLIVCALLFAMGLQNSFVTKISNAVVRTTHLTGLFTDLGIDVSHLFFPELHPDKEKLKESIKLRIYIIAFFFAGGLFGGLCYSKLNLKLKTLIVAALILLISLLLDKMRYNLIKAKRKHLQRRSSFS
ncbi:hypothetical protein B6A10_10810 [Flavobacterium sp. L1I52]|uniref:DUF1275 domain-containing protein n=1 Tax=Flavobacterium pokkalii TaxID=1940408 RepID=A0ABR7URY5_9FLAO|nr:YoaK family protein [Flavobacterium pokkalii]MBD0725671.1 hypothetical protein [Flavobacterium pokkalii]